MEEQQPPWEEPIPASESLPEEITQKSPENTPSTWLRAPVILNVVFLIGLIVLYILHFTRPVSQPVAAAVKMSKNAPLKIVYVNSDTIMEKYELVSEMMEELEGTMKKLENDIKTRQVQVEEEAAVFQEQVNNRQISEEKAQARYQELMEKQQTIVELKEKYSQQMSEKEYDLNVLLVDSVNNFLRRFNKQHGYDYIMQYKFAGSIFLANDSLDITSEVIEALNGEYRKSGKKK